MAIALVVHTGAGSSDSNNVTTSSIDSTGSSLLIDWCAYDGGVSPTPTDNKSNSWTGLTQRSGQFGRGRFFYSVASSIGSGHTSSLSTSSGFPALCFSTFSGASATPFDVENGGGSIAVTSVATGSITPSEDNELLVAGLMWEGPITSLTIDGTGWTILDTVAHNGSTNYGCALAYKIQTTATAENRTWSWTNTVTVAAAIASFKVAAAGGTDQPIEKRHGGVPFMSAQQLRAGGVRGGVW